MIGPCCTRDTFCQTIAFCQTIVFAEVTGLNPVEALIFFRLLHSNCLNWKFTAKITYHLHIYPQFIYESFHIIHVISLLSRENKNSQLTSLPMCGFIAQLVEHRTGIRGGHEFESR